MIPNTGHLVFLEAPARYDELVLKFPATPMTEWNIHVPLSCSKIGLPPRRACGQEREKT